MKVCSHCKTQNNDSANYCRQCGFVFPDVNLQSGNIDNSLVDKVNELQNRVSDAEANSNNSKRNKHSQFQSVFIGKFKFVIAE